MVVEVDERCEAGQLDAGLLLAHFAVEGGFFLQRFLELPGLV